MSATQTATELGIPTLDVASFQKLLMAAWVIQCERERLRDLPDPFERDCPPDQFAIDILGEASERASAIEAVMAGVPGDHDVLAIDPSAKIPPARAERICSDEVSGALALAPAPETNALIPVASGLHSIPQVARNTGAKKRSDLEHPSRSALIVVPFPARKAQVESAAARFLRSIPASIYICAILVSVALIALVTFRIERHHNLLPSANRPMSTPEKQPDVVASPSVSLPFLQSSHLRVTDAVISSELGDLSRYEMRSIRRQAEFGDAKAALTLAMAQEVGAGVPQSCAQATHWVELAAKDGNAAAQYNLALRYVYGDGVPASHDQGLRWLRASATQGYGDAQAALAHLNLPQ